MTEYDRPGGPQPPFASPGLQPGQAPPPLPGQPPLRAQPGPVPPPLPAQAPQPYSGQPAGTPAGFGQTQPGGFSPAGFGQTQPGGFGQTQPGYGPPLPGYQPPQRGQGRVWLIGVGIGAVVTILIVLFAVALKPGPSSPAPGGSPGADASQPATSGPSGRPPSAPPGTVPAGLISGKDGLSASACRQSGQAPWKIIKPATVCGMPMGSDSTLQNVAQSERDTAESQFTDPGGFGSYTSTVAFQAAYPVGSSSSPFLGIQVFGFTGKITSQSGALKALESIIHGTFYDVPAGPHGGIMQCADETDFDIQECMFATRTTLGDIQFTYQAFNIPADISADASAITVRNAIEVGQ